MQDKKFDGVIFYLVENQRFVNRGGNFCNAAYLKV